MTTRSSLQNQINILNNKVGCLSCCEDDFGITTLSPPVIEPEEDDPTVLFNTTTGELFYWDGDSWEIGNINEGINVKSFGATGDGVTDDTTSIQLALTTLNTLGGGHLFFPIGIYRVNGLIRIPNDGQALPYQNPIRISGESSFKTGSGNFTPDGGTIIDLRYGGADVARIITTGVGSLTIENILFQSINASASISFIFTSNTTLNIRNCGFYGRNGVGAADETAIILGAQTAIPVIDGTDDAPFQGYGTVIESNWFNQIERGVYGGTYCNGVVVRDNTFWNRCGGEAAIDIGSSGFGDAGNVIMGNLIEMIGYKYGIKILGGNNNTIIGNNFYDPGGAIVTNIYFDATAGFNFVIEGFNGPFSPSYIDLSDQNTILTAEQAIQSNFTQGIRVGNLDVWAGGIGPKTHHPSNGRYFYSEISGLGVDLRLYDGGVLDVIKIQRAGSTTEVVPLGGDNNKYYLGSNFITGSTGSPEGVKTAPVGSMYLRSDGGANTTLYIKESGSGNTGWIAK